MGSRTVGSRTVESMARAARHGACCVQEDSWLTGESEASSGALLCALALLDAGHFDGVRP